MIKITGINRKVSTEQFSNAEETIGGTKLVLANHTCNCVMVADEFFNKGHFRLTGAESREFDELCERVERRIAHDIGNPEIGITALQPKIEWGEK